MNFKEMAAAAGIKTDCMDMGAASCVYTDGCDGVAQQEFEGALYIAYAEGRKDERDEWLAQERALAEAIDRR